MANTASLKIWGNGLKNLMTIQQLMAKLSTMALLFESMRFFLPKTSLDFKLKLSGPFFSPPLFYGTRSIVLALLDWTRR